MWSAKAAAAFVAVKRLLISKSVLTQYCENLPLVLACDASPYRVGAVLSHKFPNSSEAPVTFFSRTLAPAERNYSQLDKEALALVAGVKKFHDYLYGRPFALITDHKPLLGLLAGDRQTPQVLSPRLTRWSVFLPAYSYTLIHIPGKNLAHADALSCCPLNTLLCDLAPASAVFLIDSSLFPLTAVDIARVSARDRVISSPQLGEEGLASGPLWARVATICLEEIGVVSPRGVPIMGAPDSGSTHPSGNPC